MRKIYLHIGSHKTGTTSIQSFMFHNKGLLKQRGKSFYSGSIIESNHVELHVASMRPDRYSPIKINKQLFPTSGFIEEAKRKILSFSQSEDECDLVFSAEGLFYLRYPDELKRLRNILPSGEVEVVVYLREKYSFLESYRRQLTKMGISLSRDKKSFSYVEEDSWLVDYDDLLFAYRGEFGEDCVKVFDYESVMHLEKTVLFSFVRCLGLNESLLGVDLLDDKYWLNRSGK